MAITCEEHSPEVFQMKRRIAESKKTQTWQTQNAVRACQLSAGRKSKKHQHQAEGRGGTSATDFVWSSFTLAPRPSGKPWTKKNGCAAGRRHARSLQGCVFACGGLPPPPGSSWHVGEPGDGVTDRGGRGRRRGRRGGLGGRRRGRRGGGHGGALVVVTVRGGLCLGDNDDALV